MMALVGMLSFNFLVILPLLARFSFDKPASGYASLMIAMGIGSVLGALVAGARGRVSNRLLVISSGLFGVLILLLGRGTHDRAGRRRAGAARAPRA